MISGGIKLKIKLIFKSINGYPDNWLKNIVGNLFSSLESKEKIGDKFLFKSLLIFKGIATGAAKVNLMLLFIGLSAYFTMLNNKISIGISSFSFFIWKKTFLQISLKW